MLFKSGSGTFPFWAPDVYEGSPALTTALMSTLAKVVSMATLFKLTVVNADLSPSFQMVIVIVSMASMTLGISWLASGEKRMLAFSGISHAGFMLMTILSISNAAGTLLYYTAAYALAGIAAFSVILCKTI
jgi:NADH-quinone oxidoreductase subunit N